MAQITESPLPVNFEEFRCNLNLPLPGNDCGNRNVSVAEKDSYCGRDCLRRFRIVYQVNSDSDEPAKNQVSCLQRWGLMHDIRSDITRTSYFGVVIFKLRQKATKEIFTVYSAPAVPLT
jgi:hypothetical protein